MASISAKSISFCISFAFSKNLFTDVTTGREEVEDIFDVDNIALLYNKKFEKRIFVSLIIKVLITPNNFQF